MNTARVQAGQLEPGAPIAKPEAGKVLRERDFGAKGVWVEYRSEKTWMIRMVPIAAVRVEVVRSRATPAPKRRGPRAPRNARG